jgi:hypothetical protein
VCYEAKAAEEAKLKAEQEAKAQREREAAGTLYFSGGVWAENFEC